MSQIEELQAENDRLSKELLGLQMFLQGAYGTVDTSEISDIMGKRLKLLVSAACYIDDLQKAAKSCSGELHHCIGKINDDLKSKITGSDLQPPEYYDYQTVHELDDLLNQKTSISLKQHNIELIEEFCAFLKHERYLDATTHNGALDFIARLCKEN